MKSLYLILLAVGALVGIWALPLFVFKATFWVVIGIGLWEYARMALSTRVNQIFTLLLGFFVSGLMIWVHSTELRFGGFALGLFFLFLWGMVYKNPVQEIGSKMGKIWLGVSYLGFTLPFWCWIREYGAEWVMLLLIPTSLTDTFAMTIGKWIGSHKVTSISPNKTLEGFMGGLAGGVFGIWIASKIFFWGVPTSWSFLIPTGLLISLLVMIGDLNESLLKRSFGVKDSSHLIPDHGGALDRLDALVYVGPFFYYWMMHRGFHL